jgi:superfamily II DNA or RNA helicase
LITELLQKDAYDAFLDRKAIIDPATGLDSVPVLSVSLFDFQRDIVAWALRRGRAAIFADCGLGKTLMQLEWARRIPGDVLILAPLAVSAQTVREGDKFGITVRIARKQPDVVSGITITNYEMLQHFDPSRFAGIVLDESSILKSYDGKTRTQIIESFAHTPFRLACTATPAPNDYMELGNHAEFLGVMSRVEMLSMFFVHDGGETQKWRLKGHAETEFWKWMASWAVCIRKPSDLDYDNRAFILPALELHQITVPAERPTTGFLFAIEAQTLQERLQARRETVAIRVAKCAELVNATKEQFIIWCNLNSESQTLSKSIVGAVEVTGSDTPEFKEECIRRFQSGEIRVLVTKPSMFGFGLNLQCCANMAFVGLSDSYEQYYQAMRRCWRFGQSHTVNVYVITAETEGAVISNIQRKETESMKMAEAMVEHMKDLNKESVRGMLREKSEYRREVAEGDGWTLHLADCVDATKDIPDDSIHYTIFSPPFASLYTYSNSDRDMGNCKDSDEFFEHYRFLVRELYRVTMPGRLVSFHCMNLPTSKVRDGVIGLRDFRGELIRMHESEGWIFHSEVCIWKDPVTAMQRTKALGLLWKQLKKDSTMSRQGIPDYLVTMRKPGENPERVTHTAEEFPVALWQNYASPIWMDIDPSDTISHREARENEDERHIAPLQLQVIDRGIRLWSNPGDTVFSPFAGVGSEGYSAIRMGRRFLGIELKRAYWLQAIKNLEAARNDTGKLF